MYNEILNKLKKYGQEHLLSFYDSMTEKERSSLLQDIDTIDFNLVFSAYANIQNKRVLSGNIMPMQAEDSTAFSPDKTAEYISLGMKAIEKGEVAALTMCGGQGTRLGHSGPKGTYDIGLKSHRSLFQIQCDDLMAVGKGRIPWYVMTSYINHDDTIDFFEAHNFFGYPKEKIFFFKQDMICVLNQDGKILLENKCKILKSPNGNGGMFVSLKKSGGLEDMKKRGIKHLFICGIDNCLVKMADPLFVGFYMKEKVQVAAKSFMKRNAEEKAAVFCYSEGKPYVIEYTEIPKTLAEMKDDAGNYVYGDANVLNYIFDLDIIEKICEFHTPYHAAIKKVTYMDPDSGELATISNALKFELFLFDYFSQIEDIKILRIDRNNEFAPVKNLTGNDSVVTAREMYVKIHSEEANTDCIM